jgi:transposase
MSPQLGRVVLPRERDLSGQAVIQQAGERVDVGGLADRLSADLLGCQVVEGADPQLPADARERIAIALAMIDSLDGQLRPLEAELRKLARRQTGCRALMAQFGMGELTALMTLCELGDVQRLSAKERRASLRADRQRRARVREARAPSVRDSPHGRGWSGESPTARPHRAPSADAASPGGSACPRVSADRSGARRCRSRPSARPCAIHILRELGPAALEPITTT